MRIADLRFMWEFSYDRTWKILDKAELLTSEQFSGPPPICDRSVQELLVHQLSTERGWRTAWITGERIEGLDPADFPDVATLRSRWELDRTEMFDYLDNLSDADLDELFLDAPLWQFIVHVWNHDTQHRSEVAMLLTHWGQSPGDLDLAYFIFDRAEQQ